MGPGRSERSGLHLLPSIPGDDRHQVLIILTGITAEIGVDLAESGIDGERVVRLLLQAHLLPDTAYLNLAASWRGTEQAKERGFLIVAVKALTDDIDVSSARHCR